VKFVKLFSPLLGLGINHQATEIIRNTSCVSDESVSGPEQFRLLHQQLLMRSGDNLAIITSGPTANVFLFTAFADEGR